jgi:hypothetical protein
MPGYMSIYLSIQLDSPLKKHQIKTTEEKSEMDGREAK